MLDTYPVSIYSIQGLWTHVEWHMNAQYFQITFLIAEEYYRQFYTKTYGTVFLWLV
jgi:hypothetical protein